MSERVCVYPGSFDPVTVGHVDIIRRACTLFDKVVVGVLYNQAKKGCFSMEERLAFLRKATIDLPQVECVLFEGLTVDFARKYGACAIVRGARTEGDFSSEYTLSCINRRLYPACESILLPCSPEYSMVSSSAVRELASFHADYSFFLPESVRTDIQQAFDNKYPKT